MRQIGTIESPERAQQFAAYLTTRGTTCSVDQGQSGQNIWIHEEDRVAAAREELQRFLSEPDHDRYRDATRQAEAVVRERRKSADAARRRIVDVRDRWNQPMMMKCPVTFGLMLLMMVVGWQTGLDPREHLELYRKLVFSMDEIRTGEVWRLVTPIFIHFNVLHFIFNLLWLRDLGMTIEYKAGSLKYLAMVLFIAILSNYAQYQSTGPAFGGMSGVNYGLFGYIWVRSRMDPESGYWISQSTVVMLLGWFVMCIVLPNMDVANWAHSMGLILGAALGASSPVWKSLTGRR